ncbi:MAG: hypothetical protein LVS60_02645 [Nodosilinea sp. LVE1205-7]
MLLLGALVTIYRVLEIGLVPASQRRQRFCHGAFSIYLAWTTVLTFITLAATLYSWGWRDRTEV